MEPIGEIEAVKVSEAHDLVEMGDCYGSRFWNKGYATEALKAFMKYMFNECESLETIGDISKWYIKQVLDFNHMFKRCSKLSCNISSWKFNKKARISNMNDSAEGVKLPS